MEWILWIIGYCVIGSILAVILWKVMGIHWEAERGDTKALIIVTPIGWPLVLLFVAGIWLFKR